MGLPGTPFAGAYMMVNWGSTSLGNPLTSLRDTTRDDLTTSEAWQSFCQGLGLGHGSHDRGSLERWGSCQCDRFEVRGM